MAVIVESMVKAINNGAVPDVQMNFNLVVETVNKRITDEAIARYTAEAEKV